MKIIIQVGQLILSLSILVIIHEFGHFLFARLFRTRVEKFYLFFNPGFSIFKIKKGDTEYGLGWLPLGGYVKISGMIDESMDKEQLKQPPQPYEFRSKPAWQRLFIMLGGVTFNFLTAILIYIILLFNFGEEYLPNENVTYGVIWDSLAMEQGFRNGDKILLLDGKEIERYSDIDKTIVTDAVKAITIERNGKKMTLTLPNDFVRKIIAKEAFPITRPVIPNIIDSVSPKSEAMKIGLMKGDRLIEIDSIQIHHWYDILENISGKSNHEIALTIVRQNDTIDKIANVPATGKIGIAPLPFITKTIKYSVLQSIPRGIESGVQTLVSYIKQIKYVFTKEGAKSIGGFGRIASLFPKAWNWIEFWQLTALLSIILAFMNVLPIPALDGGHVMFLMYEIITGRKPGDKFLEYAQIAGMILLLTLLLYANGNDIYRGIQNWLGK
ncbi:MAG TPA: RIP metalloprotease RseP [Bacteroidales bacterium]|nr:RIP metalloprotease RseP [Bacteroidales bacterium]